MTESVLASSGRGAVICEPTSVNTSRESAWTAWLMKRSASAWAVMSTTFAPRLSISARSSGFDASIAPTLCSELAIMLDSDNARSFGVANTVTFAGRMRAI